MAIKNMLFATKKVDLEAWYWWRIVCVCGAVGEDVGCWTRLTSRTLVLTAGE
jgi:hypothetical protein